MYSLSAAVSSILRTRCPACFRYQHYATRKRFFRGASIVQTENNKWEVTLDHRRLKTPNGRVLTVESEVLARTLAAEWDAQIEAMNPPTMHVTALCNTSLDNPGKLSKEDIANYLLNFLPTDTLLFHSEDEKELWEQQQKKWVPVLDWFNKRFEIDMEFSKGLDYPPVSAKTKATLTRHFLSYNFVALNAITFGVDALKSTILMLACIDRFLTPEEAVMLARLEEEYQASRWGRVPWAHELNQAELTARVAASLLVVQCCSEGHSAKIKTPDHQHQSTQN